MLEHWVAGLEGTPEGQLWAHGFALAAALLHAVFGALQNGRHDPWLSRAAIDTCYGLIALPVVLLIAPWPEPHMWPILAVVWLVHVGYKLLQAAAYSRGSYTVVYPVVRGTAPLFAMLGATLLFAETYTLGQWAGVAVLVAAIYGLALVNLRGAAATGTDLMPALLLAVATGSFVALYTAVDAYGIRATADPLTFLAWFFLIDSLFMPALTWRRWSRLPRSQVASLARRGVVGALVAIASFGGIMMATRLGSVGQAAVLRETSTVFSALIGWLMLGERTDRVRVALLVLIAVGAVSVQMAAR